MKAALKRVTCFFRIDSSSYIKCLFHIEMLFHNEEHAVWHHMQDCGTSECQSARDSHLVAPQKHEKQNMSTPFIDKMRREEHDLTDFVANKPLMVTWNDAKMSVSDSTKTEVMDFLTFWKKILVLSG